MSSPSEPTCNPFPLLDLPYLAWRIVLENLRFNDLLNFSRTSRRAERAVELCRFSLPGFDIRFGDKVTIAHDTKERPNEQLKVELGLEETGDRILKLFRVKITGISFVDEFHSISSLCRWAPLFDTDGVVVAKKKLSVPETNFVFNRFHRLESLVFFSPLPKGLGTVEIRSKFFGIDDARALNKESLLAMQCERVVLGRTRFKNSDLLEFVEDWRNGGNRNLISLIVNGSNITDDLTNCLDGLNWDPKRRSRKFRTGEGSWNVFDCKHGLDVQRKEDGLLATFLIRTDGKFAFVVWWNRFEQSNSP